MDRSSIYGLSILIIFCIVQYSAAASHQITLTKIKLASWNQEYLNMKSNDIGVVPVNYTYNKVPFQWDIARDFPQDIILQITLSYSNSKDEDYKLYDTYVTYLCDETDELREYLPESLIAPAKDGNCFQKGTYDIEDTGFFRFDKLLESKLPKARYFKLDYKFRSHKLLLLAGSADLESIRHCRRSKVQSLM